MGVDGTKRARNGRLLQGMTWDAVPPVMQRHASLGNDSMGITEPLHKREGSVGEKGVASGVGVILVGTLRINSPLGVGGRDCQQIQPAVRGRLQPDFPQRQPLEGPFLQPGGDRGGERAAVGFELERVRDGALEG